MKQDNETAHKLFEIYGKLKIIKENGGRDIDGLRDVLLQLWDLAYNLLPEKTPKDD